jgi:hypothetical protein
MALAEVTADALFLKPPRDSEGEEGFCSAPLKTRFEKLFSTPTGIVATKNGISVDYGFPEFLPLSEMRE